MAGSQAREAPVVRLSSRTANDVTAIRTQVAKLPTVAPSTWASELQEEFLAWSGQPLATAFDALRAKKGKYVLREDGLEMLAYVKNQFMAEESARNRTFTDMSESFFARIDAASEEAVRKAHEAADEALQKIVATLRQERLEGDQAGAAELRRQLAALEARGQEESQAAARELAGLRGELEQVRREFAALKDEQVRPALQLNEQLRATSARDATELRAEMAALRTDVGSTCKEVETTVHGEMSRMMRTQAARDVEQDAQAKKVEMQLRETLEKIQAEIDTAHAAFSDVSEQTVTTAESTLDKLARMKHANIIAVEADLRCLRSQFEGLTARRVEWHVDERQSPLAQLLASAGREVGDEAAEEAAQAELLMLGADEDGWVAMASPPFDVAGASGLRLELRARPRPPPGGAAAGDHAGARGGLECALALQAPEGLALVFRLTLAGKTVQLQHLFTGAEPASAACCAVLEQAALRGGGLLLAVELLELRRSLISAGQPQGLYRAGERRDSMPLTGSRASLAAAAAEEEPPSYPFVLHQHVTARTHELLQEQVDYMKSLLCRRVSWCLERASGLPRSFARGEPLCSRAFAAAGIEGLQLLFYPSGYDGAKDGYCSLFVLCPAGTSLHCWLGAGRQRRDARVSFSESEGLFGRTNFCRFSECLEASTDTVTLTFDVEDATASLSDALEHTAEGAKALAPAVREAAAAAAAAGDSDEDGDGSSAARSGYGAPGQRPRPQTTAGVLLGTFGQGDRGAGSDCASALPAVTSCFTRQRSVGKTQLPEVQQLPSLWTAAAPCNVGELLEGFHTFRDPRLVAKKPPGKCPTSTPRRRELLYGNPAGSQVTSKASLAPGGAGFSQAGSKASLAPLAPFPGALAAGGLPDPGGGAHRYHMYS